MAASLVAKTRMLRGFFEGLLQAVLRQEGITGQRATALIPCVSGALKTEEIVSPTGIYLFAAPKKRRSHSKKRMRMAHKWPQNINHYTVCSLCGNPKLFHVLCAHCLKKTLEETARVRRAREEEVSSSNREL